MIHQPKLSLLRLLKLSYKWLVHIFQDQAATCACVDSQAVGNTNLLRSVIKLESLVV